MKKISMGGMLLSSMLLTACSTTTPVVLKDGDYSQRQSYNAGEKGEYTFYIDVNASIKDGKIASMDVLPDPNGQATQMYATEFQKGIKDQVVGKTLEEAKALGYVSGASLTSKAFADAVDALEAQAGEAVATTAE